MTGQAYCTIPEYAQMRRVLLPHTTHVAPQAPNARYGAGDYWTRSWPCALQPVRGPDLLVAAEPRRLNHDLQRFLQILGRTPSDDMLETGGDILEASVGLVAGSGRLNGPVKVAVD